MDTSSALLVAGSVLAGLSIAATLVARAMRRESRGLQAAIRAAEEHHHEAVIHNVAATGTPARKPPTSAEDTYRAVTGREPPTLTAEDEEWVRGAYARLRDVGDRSAA